jgi:hypothetical protein
MPVCIAGMHRSGTSMVAKLLYEAGLYLGPEEDLHPPGPANPEGFWENRRFVRLNQQILIQLGAGWDYPPPLPVDWTVDRLTPLRAEAETLLEHFTDREPWGWKDPRNCLTLPFWQSLLDRPRVVVVVRNPLEVAHSLRKRNGFSPALGLALWHAHNQRLVDFVEPSDRMITHYGMYFRDPEREFRRLLTFLDLPVAEDVIEKASTAMVADLRHHQLTMRDLIDADVPLAIVELYRDLCAAANWIDAPLRHAESEGTEGAFSEDGTTQLWDEPSSTEFTGRQRRPPNERGPARLRGKLEEAEARIAELEHIVQAQQQALAEHEAVERELIALRRLVADRAEGLGLAGDQLRAMIGPARE